MLKVTKEIYETIDDGEYLATLKDIQELNSAKQQYGPSLRFSFTITEDPYIGRVVSGLVNKAWKSGNKLDRFLTALGVDPSVEAGVELDVENLKGKVVRVYIETPPDSTYANVKFVKPLRTVDLAKVSGTQTSHIAANPAPVSTGVSEVETDAGVRPTIVPVVRRNNVPF